MSKISKISNKPPMLRDDEYLIVHDKILSNLLYLVRNIRIRRTGLMIEAGYTKSHLAQMLNHKLKIPPRLLNFVCNKYGFTIDYFFIDSFDELYKATKPIVERYKASVRSEK